MMRSYQRLKAELTGDSRKRRGCPLTPPPGILKPVDKRMEISLPEKDFLWNMDSLATLMVSLQEVGVLHTNSEEEPTQKNKLQAEVVILLNMLAEKVDLLKSSYKRVTFQTIGEEIG